MPSGQPLWPEFWPLDELELLRKELPYTKWMAQYMQNPTSDASAIVKREWWRVWEEDSPPPCEFILMSWDTAFEKHNRADYSACTVWGVFYMSDDGSDPEVHKEDRGRPQANIILLNAFRDRLEFPDLKRVVLREYKEWQPDGLIIEKKASGAPLIYEMRAMGIPASSLAAFRLAPEASAATASLSICPVSRATKALSETASGSLRKSSVTYSVAEKVPLTM
jgi:phage terminase large subunit-like protein